MATSSPDNIFYRTGTDTFSDAAESSTQASSIQNALNLRQSYSFIWANATARGAQTGMVQGSTGYQIDTSSAYIFDNAAWRLTLSYAEFSVAAQNVTVNTYVPIGTLTVNSGKSTDTAFVTGSGGGFILTNPGVYSFSLYSVSTSFVAASNNSYVQISDGSNPSTAANQLMRGPWLTGTSTASVSIPFYNCTVAGQVIYIWYNFASGTTPSPVPNVTSTVRIGRLG